jgi:hypothetical protein
MPLDPSNENSTALAEGSSRAISVLGIALLRFATLPLHAQAAAPKNGYVPDEKTAIKIAEAVLAPIEGSDEAVKNDGPYTAILHGNTWSVAGKQHPGPPGSPYMPVGAIVVSIDKTTGEIIGIIYPR